MQNINLSSSRARKARLAILLEKQMLRVVCGFTALLFIFAAFYFALLSEFVFSGACMAMTLYLLTPIIWYAGELKNLPPGDLDSSDPTEYLEPAVLGRLKGDVTPQKLVEVCMKTQGGVFFANRFAILPDFLQKVSSNDSKNTAAVFNQAQTIAKNNNRTSVTAADITAALILQVPESSYYLAQLKIDSDDIIAGTCWYNHLQDVIKKVSQKQSSGGIGRDLSFGWAPLLNRVGINISESVSRGTVVHREIEGHMDGLGQITHLLSQPGRRNAALIGEIGVGKTTLVYALAQRIMNNPKAVDPNLRFRQIIELDAASLLSRAKGRGELEELLIRLFNEAIHAKNIILFLDEAHLFLKEGTGSIDLSNLLLPVLEGGALQIILALSDQDWLRLSQENPGLAQLMNRVVINPLNQEETMSVIEDQILLLEGRNNIIYSYQSLKEAYSLADRFIRDQAFPGKAVRLLEAAAGFAEQQHFITARSVQSAVEKSFDVKVQTAETDEERATLLNLEGKIHERMINQTHAVGVVSDALRRARAGVRNQNKPIGTFLFLGPTGVGKTELSKALADVYFGGEDRLIRVDLNEFSKANDVGRLLELGSQNSNSLTAQIAKQPFSVVLLDEIEKAHPNVLNVLLQMLDEGMLRDESNKPVSFRDAIIIATSNAGADKIRAHIEAGESLEQFEDQFINELIDSNIFRPEFINRFDETVLFRPLTKAELIQVIDLIIGSINKTLASQKVAVSLSPEAKILLVDAGYDPRLGARPLRRVTQRSIENIIAQKLLSGSVMPGTTIALEVSEIQAALSQRSS